VMRVEGRASEKERDRCALIASPNHQAERIVDKVGEMV